MFRPDRSVRFVLLAFVFFAAHLEAGALPTVTLTVPDDMAAEAGPDPATITITRTADAGTGASLRVYLQSGGTAQRTADYTVPNLVFVSADTHYATIPIGSTSITLTVTPVRDNLNEGNETFTLAVLPPQLPGNDYLIGNPSSGQVTISDDVATATITAPDAVAAELGQDPGTITVSRSNQGNTAVTLRVYLELGGSATRTVDYTVSNLVFVAGNLFYVVIPGGALNQSVVVTPIFDEAPEGDETVILTVFPPQLAGNDYLLGEPSVAMVTILDHVPALMKDGFENLAR